eukprot:39261-Chlamydomonas_euryale.AAC.4
MHLCAREDGRAPCTYVEERTDVLHAPMWEAHAVLLPHRAQGSHSSQPLTSLSHVIAACTRERMMAPSGFPFIGKWGCGTSHTKASPLLGLLLAHEAALLGGSREGVGQHTRKVSFLWVPFQRLRLVSVRGQGRGFMSKEGFLPTGQLQPFEAALHATT